MTSLVSHTNLTTTRVFSACEVARPWIIHYYYYYPLWLMFEHTDRQTDRQSTRPGHDIPLHRGQEIKRWSLQYATYGCNRCHCLKFACDCMTSLVNHTNLTTTRVFSACEVARPWKIRYYYYYPLWLMFKHTDKQTDGHTDTQTHTHLH